MKHFGDIMFTPLVKAEQARLGSRDAYAKMTAGAAPDRLTAREAEFIGARDSFYLGTVNEDGWPYVQHRGGPRGFLKVLSPNRIGFADYRGNRQFVSRGNLSADNRASLFLMDYPRQARLKLLARATVADAADDPVLANKLAIDGGGKVERLFVFDVEAFDWNCPQFITPRFTAEEVAAGVAPLHDEIAALKAENARLRAARLRAAR
ncbi:MAG: pyridoxamine 5-phosphate oxidase [Alphaproteobacteria bacterium]|nr:pyridoxamine 5-phosphate oxidase [Alphaproteobacteria bacterium]